MNYIEEIFQRTNLQQIREFLLGGVECLHVSDENYKERLSTADKTIFKKIKENVGNEEEIINDIHHYSGITQEVYMEIGMQCGALIAMQLLTISHLA